LKLVIQTYQPKSAYKIALIPVGYLEIKGCEDHRRLKLTNMFVEQTGLHAC